MKRFLCFILSFAMAVLFSVCVFGCEISECERELIEYELTVCYPDITFVERVGICAVILNRMKNESYPDTAVGVVESLRSQVEFIPIKYSDSSKADKAYRMSRDALRQALDGADPTFGAISFRYEKPHLRDFGEKAEISLKPGELVLGSIIFSK